MRLFKKILLFLFVLPCFVCLPQAGAKQTTEWQLVSSSVKFKIRNAGINVEGSFTGLTAKIYFDASKNAGNSISASVDAKSIKTGINRRDEHLKKEEYFNVVKYPKISLSATQFTKENEGFKGYFTLTIKNISKTVVIPFRFTENGAQASFNGSFVINRLDYTVGESNIILSDDVTVEIEANVIKK